MEAHDLWVPARPGRIQLLARRPEDLACHEIPHAGEARLAEEAHRSGFEEVMLADQAWKRRGLQRRLADQDLEEVMFADQAWER